MLEAGQIKNGPKRDIINSTLLSINNSLLDRLLSLGRIRYLLMVNGYLLVVKS